MLYKKRWSDGLKDDFEHLDEFEFKYGCFGGDGGGSSSGSTQEKEVKDESTTQVPDDGFRGEQSAAAAANATAASQAVQGLQDFVSSGYQTDTPTASSQNPGYGYSSISGITNPTSNLSISSPTAVQATSYGSPDTNLGIGSLSGFSIDPVTPEQAYSEATTPTTSNIANALGINPDVNIGGYDVGFGSVPGTSGIAGPTIGIGPGTLGIGTNLGRDRFGIGYSMNFAKGGVVQRGIGGLMRRN